MLLICAFAPTLTTDDDREDEFYEELNRVFRVKNFRDIIALLDDFSAVVGRNYDIWGSIGPQGIVKTDASELLPLSLCCKYSLVVTNDRRAD